MTLRDESSDDPVPRPESEVTMLDSSPEQFGGQSEVPGETEDPQRRRRKRQRAQREKRLQRVQRKALVVFLYVLTICLVLAAWYGLLKS